MLQQEPLLFAPKRKCTFEKTEMPFSGSEVLGNCPKFGSHQAAPQTSLQKRTSPKSKSNIAVQRLKAQLYWGGLGALIISIQADMV